MNLRLLLPYRDYSQVELLESDCWFEPDFRHSGDVRGTKILTVRSERSAMWVPVIVSKPHVHAPTDWRPGEDHVYVDVTGDDADALVYAAVRRSPDCLKPVLHVNADEAERYGWPPRETTAVRIWD